ncbi:hypothetical protein BDV97DRAFT_348353 [Delphinella strobiligena]|nr:hypothetical protein BDV97DRAFT_348353 [Delphinella strobiligena]
MADQVDSLTQELKMLTNTDNSTHHYEHHASKRWYDPQRLGYNRNNNGGDGGGTRKRMAELHPPQLQHVPKRTHKNLQQCSVIDRENNRSAFRTSITHCWRGTTGNRSRTLTFLADISFLNRFKLGLGFCCQKFAVASIVHQLSALSAAK